MPALRDVKQIDIDDFLVLSVQISIRTDRRQMSLAARKVQIRTHQRSERKAEGAIACPHDGFGNFVSVGFTVDVVSQSLRDRSWESLKHV
jgi:hypothetical protein